MSEQPYIITIRTIEDRSYNPNYGDDRICECGHTYDRHFDSYDNMYPVGCKYCDCYNFVELEEGKPSIKDAGDLGYQDGKLGLKYFNPYAQYGADARWHDAYKMKFEWGTGRDLGSDDEDY